MLVAGAAVALGLTGAAEAPRPAVLDAIEPGQWLLRAVDGAAPTRTLCVADPALLLQPRHPGVSCTRYIIDNGATSGTVHYSCPGGSDYGDTRIRVESRTIVHIESQGIAGNAPFALSVEARRMGACPGTPPRPRRGGR